MQCSQAFPVDTNLVSICSHFSLIFSVRLRPIYNKKVLRIITWNCQGAFRKKFPLIASYAPDLAVIQECEQLERIPWKKGPPPTTGLWFVGAWTLWTSFRHGSA